MNWGLLEEMLSSEFWTLGGTSSFFSNAEEAKAWVEENVLLPYDGITESTRTVLLEKSEEAYNYAFWARGAGWLALTDEEFEKYGYAVDPYEAAELYWEKMTIAVEEYGDDWLLDFFRGQVDLSGETTDYVQEGVVRGDFFGASVSESIPWKILLALGALFLFVRER